MQRVQQNLYKVINFLEMSNLINKTFFVGEIILPNLHLQAEETRLDYFISKYEPECLIKIMGYPLYRLFLSESSSRMNDLLNGAEYQDGEGNFRKWNGLKYGTLSLIASYIYFYFIENNKAHTVGTGSMITKKESGSSISPADKMTLAWNFFSEETNKMCFFLWLKKNHDGTRVYPEFSYDQYLETKRVSRKIDSVFQF